MSRENEEKRSIKIPKQPPMFCMLLRKYLENAKIYDVQQPYYERILEFYIETYNDILEKKKLCLAIELMGKHSNIVLYDIETSIIIGCAHNVGSEKSRDREMRGNIPYIYPPKQNKRDFLNYFGQINYDTLSDDFLGFSKPFAFMCKGIDAETIKDFLELKRISPVISTDYKVYSLFGTLLSGNNKNSVNSMIDDYFSYHQFFDNLNRLKTKLSTTVKNRLKKAKNSLEKVERQLQKEKNADKYRKFGDLIMANLYNIENYKSFCEIFDWETNCKIKIELDETKTLKDNANRFFKLYNKAKKSTEKLKEIKQELLYEVEYCVQTAYTIDVSRDLSILEEINDEIFEEIKNAKKVDKNRIETVEICGYKVYIGKNNKQNDYIVSKLAKDNDMWFHSRNCPGSHILLKIEKSAKVAEEVIFECAKLAKQHCQGADSSKISIIYTECKNLKKPPASNLGYVTYKNEKEIIID